MLSSSVTSLTKELLTATNADDTLTADEHPFSELQGLIEKQDNGYVRL